MLKYLGMMLAFFACVMAGSIKALKLSNKAKLFEDLLHDIRCLWMRIEYTAMPLKSIINSLVQAKLTHFWKSLAAKLDEGASFDSAWCSSVDVSVKNSVLFASLSLKDIKLIKSFSALIGNSDMQSQAKSIRLIELQLDDEIKQAKDLCLRKERMYKSLGVLMGIGLVIILW